MNFQDLSKNEVGLAVARGVENAMDFWFSQHEISAPTILQEAIEASVGLYLRQSARTEEIIGAAVAEAVGDFLNENGLGK